ncbi:MAG TPA: flagellin [Alphaproteobacteria bacterium]|nr:flagellin [Alphaproteobacteria bacterium]
MALNIVSNYAANVANRYLAKADGAASNSLAKLSAGTRVLSAKDDAASLAIGARLNAEVQAQKQAKVNAGQATAMLQIADGAMSKVNDLLVRMKTLAVQAGSGQLSGTERGMLDTEYQALLAEVDRIAAVTKFNGTSLVNGSSRTDVSLSSASAIGAAQGFASIKLGNDVGNATLSVDYDATTDVLTLTNLTTGESQGVAIGSSAIAVNSIQTVNFNEIGAVVELNAAFNKSANIQSVAAYSFGTADTGRITDSSISISNVSNAANFAAQTGNVILDDTGTPNASSIYYGSYLTTSPVDLVTLGQKTITLTNNLTGDTFDLSFNVTAAFDGGGSIPEINLAGLLNTRITSTASTANETDFTFKLGTGTTANIDEITVSVGAVSASALGLNGGSITSKANADTASSAISAAIDLLNTARAGVGAAQNRLDFASDNLSTTIENSEAARSSLMDLDVASEMTAFTAKQVLVQSGVAMLAQANQMPQNLLKLFQ